VLGPLLVGIAGTVWVVCAVLFYKWKKRIERRERALRLRNRVQLHAFATDVLKCRPKPGDLLAPLNRQRLLEELRLLNAWLASSLVIHYLNLLIHKPAGVFNFMLANIFYLYTVSQKLCIFTARCYA